MDTSIDGSATQERNSDFSYIEKVGVKSLPNKIVADLDLSMRVNLANSVLSEILKFKNLGLPTFDVMGKQNETTAYSNHIKNYELETREVFERETENIPLKLQMDLVTPSHENPLTRSTDSSKLILCQTILIPLLQAQCLWFKNVIYD